MFSVFVHEDAQIYLNSIKRKRIMETRLKVAFRQLLVTTQISTNDGSRETRSQGGTQTSVSWNSYARWKVGLMNIGRSRCIARAHPTRRKYLEYIHSTDLSPFIRNPLRAKKREDGERMVDIFHSSKLSPTFYFSVAYERVIIIFAGWFIQRIVTVRPWSSRQDNYRITRRENESVVSFENRMWNLQAFPVYSICSRKTMKK